ncbi:hypothetical protein A3860_35810 [Niastella vici]|uniref:Uncharacterized protein n=1 Tax=Niastella vici TaxID=1703345 RepID=A0A1V9FNG6_9BACT|nr:hypothetical protein [Niastella vici]OQP59880.1 hypothetical protein A3860_35810 [Niastella vici]
MKLTLIPLLLLALFNSAFAQQINVTISDELEAGYGPSTIKAGNHFIRYLPMGSTNHLSYGFGWNKVRLAITVIQHDSNMVMLQNKSLSNGDRVYGPFFTDIRKINGKVYIIYHEVQEKNTIGNVMAVEINPETLEAGTPKIIGAIANTDYKLKFSESLQNSLKYICKPSPDGKRNLLLLTAGGDSKCFISVLDENMNVTWSKLQDISTSTDYNFKSACIDNSGNVYVAYKISGPKNDNRVAVIKKEASKPHDIPLNLNFTISNMEVFSSKDNKTIHVAGTYMDNPNSSMLKGVFHTKIDAGEFKLAGMTTTAFPDTLIKRFEQDGWGDSRKNIGINPGFSPRFIEKENGVLNMIGEFRSMVWGTRAAAYISGDILNVSFEESGAVFARIPKIRKSMESTIGDSFVAFPFQNKVVVFYDDNIVNLNKSITESPTGSDVYKSLIMAGAIIETDGTVNRSILIDLKKENYLAVTEYLIPVDAHSMIIPLQKIKGLGGISDKIRWARIRIN